MPPAGASVSVFVERFDLKLYDPDVRAWTVIVATAACRYCSSSTIFAQSVKANALG